MIFSEKDIEQISQKGLTLEKVKSQISLFKKGVPFVNLESAATKENGILALSEAKMQAYASLFDLNRDTLSIVKFVPASGAATRMFKALFALLDSYIKERDYNSASLIIHNDSKLSEFFAGLEKLPFYEEVICKIREVIPDFNNLPQIEKQIEFIKVMLEEPYLNYANYPKGLLPFHKYKKHTATAFEEHFFEAALYSNANNKANLHFTISEYHNQKFTETIKIIKNRIEKSTNTTFNIAFSFQKQSTDTIAVTKQNTPFRDEHGHLVFRPSGHGALLDNLNNIDADLIFIKNIDNVVVKKYLDEIAFYKKMLGGILLEVQKTSFLYLKRLENENLIKNEITEIAQFLKIKLNVSIHTRFKNYTAKKKIEFLRNKLNRPIRVCGMVKNEGEPGGGPFWVKDESGNVSLQIVESAQIDKKDKSQKEILEKSTHFNPVDIVCGIRNYKGEPFNLNKFVNPQTAFISMKTNAGKDLKALELPGLWNGSMAFWNTIFVEVPLKTFNPVKTVNDLLKAPHQFL